MQSRRVAAALAAVVVGGCTHAGAYTWADDGPQPGAEGAVIRAGDLVRVDVAQQEALSRSARVRPDGRIALPLVTEVDVAGLTPPAAAARIRGALDGYVVDAGVTVGVEERAPVRVAVMGRVARPGMYELDPSLGVLHALALAGGPTDEADDDGIYVLRRGPGGSARYRFALGRLQRGEGRGSLFTLAPGDAVIVEE